MAMTYFRAQRADSEELDPSLFHEIEERIEFGDDSQKLLSSPPPEQHTEFSPDEDFTKFLDSVMPNTSNIGRRDFESMTPKCSSNLLKTVLHDFTFEREDQVLEQKSDPTLDALKFIQNAREDSRRGDDGAERGEEEKHDNAQSNCTIITSLQGYSLVAPRGKCLGHRFIEEACRRGATVSLKPIESEKSVIETLQKERRVIYSLNERLFVLTVIRIPIPISDSKTQVRDQDIIRTLEQISLSVKETARKSGKTKRPHNMLRTSYSNEWSGMLQFLGMTTKYFREVQTKNGPTIENKYTLKSLDEEGNLVLEDSTAAREKYQNQTLEKAKNRSKRKRGAEN